MSKRFTDTQKWRNEWFRTLPLKAKLVWTYLCDECDHAGIWKVDLGLASFQLDFKVTKHDVIEWFGPRIHFFGADNLLIVPFFAFQYSGVKDGWSAKKAARDKLEQLGFEIVQDSVKIPQSPHSPPTVGGESRTLLITDIVKDTDTVNSLKEGAGENFKPDPKDCFAEFPVQVRGPEFDTRFAEQVKTLDDVTDLKAAIRNYVEHLKRNQWKAPKQSFATFLGTKKSGYFWRDFIAGDPGGSPSADNADPFSLLRGDEVSA